MTALRQRMLEDLRMRNYAPTTVACYIRSVAEFAQHFNKPPDQLGPEEIRAWQLFLLNEKRVTLSTYIQAVCALRFFYQNTGKSQLVGRFQRQYAASKSRSGSASMTCLSL